MENNVSLKVIEFPPSTQRKAFLRDCVQLPMRSIMESTAMLTTLAMSSTVETAALKSVCLARPLSQL